MRSGGHVVLRPRYRRACAVVRGAAFGSRLVRVVALALRKGVTLDDADRAVFCGSLELRGGLVTRPLGVSRDSPPIPRHVGGLGRLERVVTFLGENLFFLLLRRPP